MHRERRQFSSRKHRKRAMAAKRKSLHMATPQAVSHLPGYSLERTGQQELGIPVGGLQPGMLASILSALSVRRIRGR